MKNVLIRADANKKISMGHIMRTLSIADAFTSAGNSVRFVLADDTVSTLVQSRGYEALVLGSDYQKMEQELSLWTQDIHIDLIIVDSYYVTADYLSLLRDKLRICSGKLLYIDDVYTFPYPVDILVDYNAYATQSIYDNLYNGASVDRPRTILGPTYAPLRSMFCGIPKRSQPEKVKNILISTGGSDELHLALAIIKAIFSSVRTDWVYHFLLGAMNADKEEIKKVASEVEWVELHENVTDMRSLISSCDLVISAAGSTLYEISACGVPLITYSLADNQINGAEAFERLGLAVNVGDLRDPSSIDYSAVMSGKLDQAAVERIMVATEVLSDDYDHRCQMGKQMQEMIDGFGADRMVQEILRLV